MPAEPLTRDQWISAFALALSAARPEYGTKHAHRVGLYEWASRRVIEPAEAAKQWAAEQDARRRKPAKG